MISCELGRSIEPLTFAGSFWRGDDVHPFEFESLEDSFLVLV
jgi:hypothetical protein